MRRAVFFDRDGVLNQAVVREGRAYAPVAVQDFVILPEAVESVSQIRRAGFLAIVVTNQPEIARGELSWETLHRMHHHLQTTVGVDAIYVCPHDPSAGCSCHKPQPGLLLTAAQEWHVELSTSFLIGDRWRDVQAGQAAGCSTVLIERSYSGNAQADCRAPDLGSAIRYILTPDRAKRNFHGSSSPSIRTQT
jgi:D-glycero-D-manno-heptose 1,7-bisphosphate phosphatase